MAFRTVIVLILSFFFIQVFSAETTPQPAPTVTTPAETRKSDQELLDNKFEKLKAVLAQDSAPAEVKTRDRAYKPTNSRDVLILSFKIMFYIAILSALLYFAIKKIKKGSLGRSVGAHHKSIEVLESAHIGQNKTVNLVKILNRVLVLGVTEKNINLLTIIDDEASVKQINNNNSETASAVAGNFSASVNSFLSKFKKDGNGMPLSSYRSTMEGRE